MYRETTGGIEITVEPQYLDEQSEPEAHRHVWAYTIVIANGSDHTVQLETRHWRITNAIGQVEEVEGPGVVGEQPVLTPGDSYQYTSGCPLNTPSGTMVGHYVMRRDDGICFEVRIPPFSLDIPDIARTLN
ncbi:Co2+/Mg2+ efflux protein ApaG [Oricola sp.]|uniref:Co2+/Mg2+ efflux protein ApaG n=1 Tax=Oricola sp. TaxID=1979950 RepID=UPI0025E88394|nr:Co2+/Mg2+ efflux protein ApaG [Oricola sp.]MCI5078156.1 Co2+/Mg2+ efflux protein ApaG [Oricola sp.]